jgi:flagellar biosynthesis/type III secretory pathway M-ring protein FliF/YscJ
MPVVSALTVLAADEEFDPNTVTPGIWGFVVTFVIMIVVLLLILDMVRRIRRTNYRIEVREQLEAEARDAELAEADGQVTDASGTLPPVEPGSTEPGSTDDDPDEAPAR